VKYLCHLKQQSFEADGVTGILRKTRYNDEFTSADRNCALTPIDYKAHTECKNYNTQITGVRASGKAVSAASAAECQVHCQGQTACSFFSFSEATQTCSTFSTQGKLTDAKGWFSSSKSCDLNKISLLDIQRGTDGVEHTLHVDGETHVVKNSDRIQHTVETLNDRVYHSDSPTMAPTTAPTQWYMNPKNYWVPCQASNWTPWASCTQTCGAGGIVKRQRSLTAAHMNPFYRGPTAGIPAEPACKICSAYSSTTFKCISYDYDPARLQKVEDDAPPSYWVTTFKECTGPGGSKISPCPINCEWSEWSAWSTNPTAQGNVRRTRSISIRAAYKGLACEGSSVQEKHWQDTKHTVGEGSFCKPGTVNSAWGPCDRSTMVAKRTKTETICNHGDFYKLPASKTRVCTRAGKLNSPVWPSNSKTVKDIFACKAFAQSIGKTLFSFRTYNGEGPGYNCFASNKGSFVPTKTGLWTSATESCNLNADYVAAGKNPSKVVMTYHQTKMCSMGRPKSDYSRFETRANRPGLTEAP